MISHTPHEPFCRSLPGRIRLEFAGLQQNKRKEADLRRALALLPGIVAVDASAVTGRVLVRYDERLLPEPALRRRLEELERAFAEQAAPAAGEQAAGPGGMAAEPAAKRDQMAAQRAGEPAVTLPSAHAMAAAALELPASEPHAGPAEDGPPAQAYSPGERMRPDPGEPARTADARTASPLPARRVPLPLAVAMGGLLALGAKQLAFGRSALAEKPGLFYMSGAVAAVTGYPFLRRGFDRFAASRKLNADLVLGTAALGLALFRESLVVLGGLTVLQYMNWQRSRLGVRDMDEQPLSPEIRAYSERAGRLGFAAAGATWLLTRSPLRALGVLLASNPRPATIPVKAAWQQAELAAREARRPLPEAVSLADIAQSGTLLLERTSLLAEADFGETSSLSNDEDPDKLVCAAASLMAKANHPWKAEVLRKAKDSCRTLRTAFRVEREEDGMRGLIGGVPYCLGSLACLMRHGIPYEAYYLEAKRLESKGCEVLFLAKQAGGGWHCLGLLYRVEEMSAEWRAMLARAREEGLRPAVLEDSAGFGHEAMERFGLRTDWLNVPAYEVAERIAKLHQAGDPVLLVGEPDGDEDGGFRYLKEGGAPVVSPGELGRLLDARRSARRIGGAARTHFRLTRLWTVCGALLTAAGVIGAPLANLAGDAMSLVFLSRTQRLAQREFPAGGAARPAAFAAHGEAAAASETAVVGAAAIHTPPVPDAAPVPWHGLPWERAAERFRVRVQQGLSDGEAEALRLRYGSNRLAEKPPTPWLVSYLGQFKEFTTLILLGTTVFALLTGGRFDGLAMGAVLLANAAIGTFQERKAERIVESLNRFQPHDTKVLRDGEERLIGATELVPGDIVRLEPGDRVPADIRIVRAWNLEANEAALTGESLPVAKLETEAGGDCPLPERSCMLHMGTDISRGKALGVVVRTGMDTEIGRLMAMLKRDDHAQTPLQAKVTSISKRFIKWAFIAGSVVFAAGLLRGIPFPALVGSSITLIASAIPEGLPVTITIGLSAGLFRMAKNSVYVRKLAALETLGRATIICTDKTGTLTKNEMTVKQIASVGHAWDVSGSGYDPAGGFRERAARTGADGLKEGLNEGLKEGWTSFGENGSVVTQPELLRVLQIACLCNNSRLDRAGDEWTMQGDPTEGALLAMAYKGGIRPERLAHWHRGAEVPFDSGTGKMSVVCRDVSDGGHACSIFSKGAVESILRRCGRYQHDGKVYPLNDQVRQRILAQSERLAGGALRVLGFAYRPLLANEHDGQVGLDEKELIYAGMAGMIDPPKADVRASIEEALALGVKPVMITGDHPITAIAIAEQIGIAAGRRPGDVLSGHELDRMSDEALAEAVDRVSIYARMAPEHKQRIVAMLRRKGHVVAMTGDGVNDSPALRQADVGIAMGRAGTEVSKATADIVLKEDRFGSIVDGVKEGRTIIGNIRKAIGSLLTGNLAEILVTSTAIILGMPIPLVPIQILLMNMLTDAIPAMMLAVNPGGRAKQTERTDIVDKPLYRKVIARGVLLGAGALGLFGLALASGQPVPVAQSIAFATLVAGQLGQTLSWRREGSMQPAEGRWREDRYLIGAMALSCAALLAALYVPALNGFFHTSPIPPRQWLPILLVAGSVSRLSKPILALLERKGAGAAPLSPAGIAA
ncbi:ATPase, P-type (transporting), HAD superfamily, subfamily IC [Paenibacillus sp. UNC496MF]|nr:HAD-IC family P-type ATPase [Paenibacillus sp. UNC496MF]SFI81140.1 ATPase, P-type (transporting), HAD superfamily, subfamily IC [Paenibacillus sp. UNC496MF]